MVHHINNIILFLTILFAAFQILHGQQSKNLVAPKWEVRAVWLTTAGGSDWPKTYDVERQKSSLIEIFDDLKQQNFNTVFFQVRSRGNTFHQSQYEPWASELTGTLGEDPGWDPLQFAIEEAHKRGLEIHAWFNVTKVYGTGMPALSSPRHIVRAHPDWVRQYKGEWWMDFGKPETREYTINLVMELVEGYDLDGIHFDFIRYPGIDFEDWGIFRLRGNGQPRDDWRRENISAFVREVYDRVLVAKPLMKIGSAPVGIYRPIFGAQSSFSGYLELFQDSRAWLRDQIHDYLAPQIYWDFGEQAERNDPDFRALCIDWSRNTYGRQVYSGLGAYRENVQNEILDQIHLSRSVGNAGQSIFRYGFLSNIPDIDLAYKYPALIPSMPWKDSVPPLPPANIRVTESQNGSRVLQWDTPVRARDGDVPYRYVVYRSLTDPVDIENPRNIIAVLPAPQRIFIDDEPRSKSFPGYYTVTSLDRGNNEGTTLLPPTEMVAGLAPLLLPAPQFSLAQNFPNPFSGKTYISYELAKRSPVELLILDSSNERPIVLVSDVQEAGTYVISVDAQILKQPGTYTYQLRAGAFSQSRTLDRVNGSKR